MRAPHLEPVLFYYANRKLDYIFHFGGFWFKKFNSILVSSKPRILYSLNSESTVSSLKFALVV